MIIYLVTDAILCVQMQLEKTMYLYASSSEVLGYRLSACICFGVLKTEVTSF